MSQSAVSMNFITKMGANSSFKNRTAIYTD